MEERKRTVCEDCDCDWLTSDDWLLITGVKDRYWIENEDKGNKEAINQNEDRRTMQKKILKFSEVHEDHLSIKLFMREKQFDSLMML